MRKLDINESIEINVSSELLLSPDEKFIKINEGAIAEQFTAQELLAYRDYYQIPSLYYWAREARSSNAEIDYLIPCRSSALPIEVKAGKTGTLRSMHIFLEKYGLSAGVRISQLYFSTPYENLMKIMMNMTPKKYTTLLNYKHGITFINLRLSAG